MVKEKQSILYNIFNELHISYQTFTHEPLFTIEQAVKISLVLPGPYVKNLFLKDNKKQLWLLVAHADTQINLKESAQLLNAPGLRFADQELLKNILGVLPGSVTPFGIINDVDKKVTIILDQTLFNYVSVGMHPLENTATTFITPQDLVKFIESRGNKYVRINFLNKECYE